MRGRHLLYLAALLACTSGCRMATSMPGGAASQAVVQVVSPWERLVDGAYENKGLAQIERLGNRWVLNVMCDGIHATFVDETTLGLEQYAAGYVSARYRYVERVDRGAKCVRAPCEPVIERRVALDGLTQVAATPELAQDKARRCN